MNCRNFAVRTCRLWWVGAASLLVLPGCATRHYQAAPISAVASAAALETRSLTDL